jgi:hypothetical protein
MTYSTDDRELLVQEGKTAVIDWMILSGARFDEQNFQNHSEIEELELRNIMYFLGPATCVDPFSIVTDKEDSWEVPNEDPHHDFEVAALAVLGSPFDKDTLDSFIKDLQPIECEDFEDGFGAQTSCSPLSIEVESSPEGVNVWVAQRFRLGDFELPAFHAKMTEFVDLAEAVLVACTS